jgi:hypothetical protein
MLLDLLHTILAGRFCAMHGSGSPGDSPEGRLPQARGGDPSSGDFSEGETIPTLPAISSPYPRLQGQFTPPPRPPIDDHPQPSGFGRWSLFIAVASGIVLAVLLTAIIIGLTAPHGTGSTTSTRGSTTGTTAGNVTATAEITATAGVKTPSPIPTNTATPTGPTQQQGTLRESIFAPVAAPQGIAVDTSGNVYVTSLSQVIKYNPQGVVTASIPAQATGTLTFDASGTLWDLFPDGTLYALNAKLQTKGQYTLASLLTGAQAAYDITTRQNETAPFALQSAQFGDMSFSQNDAFISGLDASTTYPFVLRVHFNASDQPDAAKLITFAKEPGPLSGRLPSGLAVNRDSLWDDRPSPGRVFGAVSRRFHRATAHGDMAKRDWRHRNGDGCQREFLHCPGRRRVQHMRASSRRHFGNRGEFFVIHLLRPHLRLKSDHTAGRCGWQW